MTRVLRTSDRELASRYAPILLVDNNEPYEPVALGYSVLKTAAPSPSSKFLLQPHGAFVIEYAVYYDWDIGHLYDLEHIWVHVGPDGSVTRVEASAHGGRKLMDAGSGLPQMSGDRPIVYAEAGKHAHWASPSHLFDGDRQKLTYLCGPLAGVEGVHLGNPFAARGDIDATPRDHRIARLKMVGDAFTPSHLYRPLNTAPALCPWAEMEAFIPSRVRDALARAAADNKHLAAVFLDCGDTLIDERTEVKAPDSEVVLDGELIPGAREMVVALQERGHKLILVADGPRRTFENLLGKHDLWDAFEAHVISEDVGAQKPDARMFDTALSVAGLGRSDAWRTVMVGNNLSRDIKGANALGITSIFMAWSTLRTHQPTEACEVPDFKLSTPVELPALLDQLEPLLRYRAPATF